MEETSGFEEQQVLLALIPLGIFLYFGFYVFGLSIFFFIFCI